MTRVDSQILSAIVVELFDRSMDTAYTPQQRAEFLVLGKRLRGTLLNLLTAQFEANTPALLDANAHLMSVNVQLRERARELDRAAEDIHAAAALVGGLDGIMRLAVSFL